MINLLQQAQGLEVLMQAVACGCLIALALHHFFIYFLLRDKTLLLFAALASFSCLNLFVEGRSPTHDLWKLGGSWAKSALLVSLCVAAAFNLFFSRNILNTLSRAPKTDSVMHVLAYVVALSPFLLALFVDVPILSAWFVGALFLLTLMSSTLIFYATVQTVGAAHKEAWCLLGAQFCFCLQICASGASWYGWFSAGSLSLHVAQFGAVFSMLSFSFALSVRLQHERVNSEQALLEVSQARLALLESLRENEARLNTTVQERTQELEVLLQIEKKRGEQHDRIGALISHEFRNPLGIIESQAALLRREDAVGVNNIKKRVNAISSATHRLALLFEKWLQNDRLSDATSSVHAANIELSGWITNLVDRCRVYHFNHTLELLLSPQARVIWADEQLLNILLLNLIDNACKYSPSDSTVPIETRYRPNMTGIAVIDQGRGIPKQFHEEIFVEYFRVNPESKVPGTGLGLPFVKRIVSLHGGDIELISGAGQGSTFCVWLPQGK